MHLYVFSLRMLIYDLDKNNLAILTGCKAKPGSLLDITSGLVEFRKNPLGCSGLPMEEKRNLQHKKKITLIHIPAINACYFVFCRK